MKLKTVIVMLLVCAMVNVGCNKGGGNKGTSGGEEKKQENSQTVSDNGLVDEKLLKIANQSCVS